MTQGEKELILKDLCCRLPYALFVQWDDGSIADVSKRLHCLPVAIVENSKMYLRPMESMTLKEESELCKILGCDSINIKYAYANWSVGGSCDKDDMDIDFKTFGIVVEWLNAHHFDYRGLIGKGLALEAPQGIYKI